MLAPISHLVPGAKDAAVEIPPRVRSSLGLDELPQWAFVDEVNQFAWPGFDLRPVGEGLGPAYGFLPPRLFDRLREAMLGAFDARRLRSVNRH